jgi:3D (Asp-Asp-Asp) domain-containing protein
VAGWLRSASYRLRVTVAFWPVVLGVATLVAEGCAGRIRPTPPPAATGSSVIESAFTATAYCTGRVTAAGTTPTDKTVAADLTVLPMGSKIRLAGLDDRYNGVYVVMDTGSRVRGRRIDLYIRDCREAVRFGRRSARVSVVR